MGCWNESCMLTHLPIYSGERTYAIVLLEHPLYNSYCYACSNYTPLFVFEGTYDDYGSLENLSELDTEVLEALGRMAGFDESIKTFSDLTEELKARPVLFEAPSCVKQFEHRKECQMRVVFLRADAGDRLVNVLPPWNLEHLKELEAHGSKRMLEKEISMNHPCNMVAKDWIENTLNEYTLPRYLLLVKLNYVLEQLRMDWFVPSGSGSQECITDMHREYSKILNDAIESEE